MLNLPLAKIFYEIADLLEVLGVAWKPIAFRRVAQSLEVLDDDVNELYEKKGVEGLKSISGVGDAIAKKIAEFITTGKVQEYEKLQKQVPAGVLALLDIQGIGPKKASLLWKELKIKNIDDVERFARSGKIAKLKGFGEKSEAKILSEIGKKQGKKRRFLFGEAEEQAFLVHDELSKVRGVELITIAGSLRRKEVTIGDIDILVVAKDAMTVMKKFVSLPTVGSVIANGSTKSSVILKSGIQVDVRVVPRESYAAALQYFTGSKAHNVQVRKVAKKKGLKLSEYGLFDEYGKNVASGIDEEKIYEVLGLKFPSPEKRKGSGES